MGKIDRFKDHITEADTTLTINEAEQSTTWTAIDVAWSDLNILHYLIDEGYFNHYGMPNGNMDFEDVNAELQDAGLGEKVFSSDQDMSGFKKYVKRDLGKLIKLL